MINLLVDEGYAFDYLAILSVKVEKLNGQRPAFHQCASHLRSQVGVLLFGKIIRSKEYKNMKQANRETFEAVEEARYGKITAKDVDNCNMKRYNAKVALQKRFFSETSLVEVKS